MGGKTEKPTETPQQQVMVDRALAEMADYKTRWLPLQQRLSKTVTEMGKPDSGARQRAGGRSAVETEAKFSQARGGVEKALSNAGGGGSSRQKLAITGMGANQATSKGLGQLTADAAIDDAYVQGLGALTAIGRGEKATAVKGMTDIAEMSGRQAAQDAALSAQEKAGYAQVGGQIAGVGLSRIGRNPSSVSPDALNRANLSDDPIGSLNTSQGWTR